MPPTDIGNASAGVSVIDSTLYTTETNAYSVGSRNTDSNAGQKEYRYQQTRWADFLGYYKAIPELKIAVDTKANWVLGNGFEADEWTTIILNRIKGSGKDTFNSILENMERTCYIAEDAYAEIIRDGEGLVINLKPLEPSSMVVVHNDKGMILRYEQASKTPNGVRKLFKTSDIFVLSHNRMADEVHGVSVVEAVENIILMRNEAMSDWKRVLHRNIDPMWIFHLDTDDTTKISAFKTKQDAARGAGENMYIPKGAVVPELVSVAGNAGLNPLTWITQLNDYFFQAVGVPQIIVGNAKEFTDASGKIVYLAFEQRVKGRQKYVEEQLSQQLNVVINLVFPASMQSNSLTDMTPEERLQYQKDSAQAMTQPQSAPVQQAAQPNDTQVGMAGKK